MSETAPSLLVQDIGEQGLLERLQRFCPADIVGDDAAVIPSPALGQSLVVTTDVLVDGVHFSDRTTSPEDVGWRAAAANLSDLAAMGASPLGITVGLCIGGDVPVSWIVALYQGITECISQYNTPLVGGDICRSPVISISITAFGQVFPHRIIRRSAAQVGDAIVVTGVHGASRAGLELLLNPEFGKNLSIKERSHLIQAHQRPQPRLDILPQLWNILDSHPQLPTPNSGAGTGALPLLTPHSQLRGRHGGTAPTYSPLPIAGMDSSDGLADAVLQICRASGVGARLERTLIPVPPVFNQLLSPEQTWEWALYGGEDFELVLCLPPEPAEALVTQLGEGTAIIGKITADNTVWLIDSTSSNPDELLTLAQGFQHF